MNKDTKKLLLSATIFGLVILSLPLSMFSLAFILPSQYNNTFYGAMKDKLNLIETTEGKRIIFIGGSSVPFSLRSDLIKQELPDYTPVDFGLYASLGSEAMMYLANDYIRKDDIVILAPEQSSQTLSMYFNSQEMLKALDGNLLAATHLRREDREAMLASLPHFDADKLSYLVRNNTPNPTDIYRHDSFNEYGDVSAIREYNTMLNGVDSTTPISFATDIISADFIEEMNSFYQKWQDKGANLYYHFSPMNEAAIGNSNEVDSYYDYLNGQIKFEILGNPHDAILEKEWFYDTNFHLNSAGSIKYTKQMIKDIKLALKDSSKTNIDDPQKPSIKENNQGTGDNSNLAYFNVEKVNDTYQIVSLTEEGKKQKKLLIPYDIDSLKITSFKDSVFKDNTFIEEITIQDNIRTLYDGSFSGCTSLAKINLNNPNPSSVTVGGNLLSDCSANIYVPKDVLSSYKVNYFWSSYADRIYSQE